MNNLIQVVLSEFKEGLKPFRSKKPVTGRVLLAFENGFLSLESNRIKTVMRAEGQWDGRAQFSGEILRALALVPPSKNPVTISYAQNRILIEGMTIACTWQSNRDDGIDFMIDVAMNPDIIDFLAMDRVGQRVNVGKPGISQKIRGAKEKMERRVKNASIQLRDLGISEAEIRALIDTKIEARINAEKNE
jgi:hypothetical protein